MRKSEAGRILNGELAFEISEELDGIGGGCSSEGPSCRSQTGEAPGEAPEKDMVLATVRRRLGTKSGPPETGLCGEPTTGTTKGTCDLVGLGTGRREVPRVEGGPLAAIPMLGSVEAVCAGRFRGCKKLEIFLSFGELLCSLLLSTNALPRVPRRVFNTVRKSYDS